MDKPDKIQKPSRATEYVFQNYERAKKVVEAKAPMWKEWMKAYRSVINLPKEDMDSSISRLVIPLIFSDVEAIGPRLMEANPRIEVHGREPEDENRAALMRLVLFYFWDLMGMAMQLINFVKAAEIYGTAIWKVVYKQTSETRLVREIDVSTTSLLGIPIGIEKKIIHAARDVMTWDDPFVSLCEIDQVFPDPDGMDISSCSYVIHRTVATLPQLEAAMKDGKPLYKKAVLSKLKKRLRDQGNPRSEGSNVETIVKEMKKDLGGEPELSPDLNKHEMHLLENWEDARVITVIEEFPDLDPIRNEYNDAGEKPFVKFTPIPVPNEFYGISIPEVLFSMQVELSSLHSMNLDNLAYSIHQMWKILKTSGINPRNIRFRPGGHIWVKEMDDIQPLQSSFNNFPIQRITSEIGQWAQKAGITDTAKGIKSELSGRTATEASLLAEASGSRISLMFQILGNQSLRPLGKKLVRLYELFMSEEKSVRIGGEQFGDVSSFIKVSPEDLLSGSGVDLDVTIDVAQTDPMTRQFRLLRAKDMLQSLSALKLPPNHPAVEYMLAEMLRGYGHPRPEQLMQSPKAQLLGAAGAAQGQPQGGDNISQIFEQLAADQGG